MEHQELRAQLAYLLSQRKSWGRRSLARAAGWGEIVVRRELERLREQGWVTMDRRGTRLTPAGWEHFGPLLQIVCAVIELQLEQLALDRATVGALLRGVRLKRERIWRYRDLAVRAGASGAIFICCVTTDGNLKSTESTRPPELHFCDSGEPVATKNRQDTEALTREFPECRPGDLLLLVSAPDLHHAQRGLWQVIVELLALELGLQP